MKIKLKKLPVIKLAVIYGKIYFAIELTRELLALALHQFNIFPGILEASQWYPISESRFGFAVILFRAFGRALSAFTMCGLSLFIFNWIICGDGLAIDCESGEDLGKHGG